MKYSINTYRLYQSEKMFSNVVRIRVIMKEPVDIDVLRSSANIAITRYPYYAVHVTVDEEGGYVLKRNRKEVVVLPVGEKTPKLGSRRVNGHLLFLECAGREINFHISHSMCGGKGILPWVLTTVYQYVSDKYHVTPYAPGIRKPGSRLLPGETAEPSPASLPESKPVFQYRSKGPVVLKKDYMNGLMNPFKRSPNYRLYTFSQKDIISFSENHDASVASFFLVVMAKALDRVLPGKDRVIGGEIAHNPREDFGLPNSHCDFLSHVHIDYDREMLKWDMQKLGTMTRGQMILQTDPSVSGGELCRLFELYDELDEIKGLKQKRAYMKANNPSTGKDAKHGTYIVNYTGQMDWGEVADYVESYAVVIEGHMVMEITSMADRIFVSFMQLLDEQKYVKAFQEVLDELRIPYKVEGPFPKRLSKHVLPE